MHTKGLLNINIILIYFVYMYIIIVMLRSVNLTLHFPSLFPVTLTLITLISLLLTPTITQPTASDSCIQYNLTSSTCIRCLPGLYLQYFFCIPCNPLCSCSSNTNYCEACLNVTVQNRQLMSYRVGDVCVLCNQTIPYCTICGNNGLSCLQCMMGRYVVDGMCSNNTCTHNCQVCRDSLRCEVCARGYSLNTLTSTCSNSTCTANCAQCLNSGSCKVCNYGYFPVSGTCTPCISNCAVCKNQQTCDVCIPSYIPSNGTCISTGISNCVQYTGGPSSPTCLVCEPGFYNSGGSCNQCNGCLLCTQSFLCQTQCYSSATKFNYACLTYQGIMGGAFYLGLGVLGMLAISNL